MGSNGIVRENAHNKTDKKKFNEGYDRIFKAECQFCGELEKKSKMVDLHDDGKFFYHKECFTEKNVKR